jgi:polyhydroxybutyrate depolymerase
MNSLTRLVALTLTLTLLPSDLYGQDGITYERSFEHDGSLRTYVLYVPEGYTGERDWPLVINYHGFTVDASSEPYGQIAASAMNEVADKARFLVAYPNGLVVTDLIFGGDATGWNVPGGYSAEQDDIAFTSSLIDHVAADFNVDPLRIHATGWSNGSEMAFYTACVLSDRIASVAGVAGGLTYVLLDTCEPGRAVSALTVIGTEDPFFPEDGNASTPPISATPSFWASNNKCSTDTKVTEVQDKVEEDNSTVTLIDYAKCDESDVAFFRINNGGHPWPGGGLIPPGLGNQNMDINASDLILKFFQRNTHPNKSLHKAAAESGGFDRSMLAVAASTPETNSLGQNYPDPFNPQTTISFSIAEAAQVRLAVYDMLGRAVRVLVNGLVEAGTHDAIFEAGELPSGTYIYRLDTPSESFTHTMLLVK